MHVDLPAWLPIWMVYLPCSIYEDLFAIESMNLLFVFSWQKSSLPVPIAALVTRITRWPLPLKLKTVSTKDDKLDNNGKCVFSLQIDEVPIFNTIVREDLLLR